MQNRTIVSPFFIDQPVPQLVKLAESGGTVNAPDLVGNDKQDRMSVLHAPLADFVAKTIEDGDRPVSISGDCCSSIGVLAGLQRAGVQPFLFWFDAHGDFNDWETSPSGFLGGMPLAMLAGRGEQRMPEAVGLQPQPEERIILTDARDLDPGERDLLVQSKVRHVAKTEDLLKLPLPEGPLYVHFDTDVLSAVYAPAQNYPVEGGPSPELLSAVFSRLAKSGRVVAASLSSWNPKLDKDGKSQDACLSVFNSLLE